jgi:hypothetical protein
VKERNEKPLRRNWLGFLSVTGDIAHGSTAEPLSLFIAGPRANMPRHANSGKKVSITLFIIADYREEEPI